MRNPLLALAALAVAGCQALPSAGPTVTDVREEIRPVSGAPGTGDFLLIDVDDSVAAALETVPEPDFSGVFPEPGRGASYHVNVGDRVTVTIFESVSEGIGGGLFLSVASASGSAAIRLPAQMVPPSGSISVPFAGRVPVAGRTPQAVERDIVERLMGKTIDPQAIVEVEKLTSNQVSVIGDGGVSGAIVLAPGQDRITEVIAAAGGVNVPLDQALVTLTRGDRIASMPLPVLLEDPAQNIRLSPGDIIAVTERFNSFTAIGATGINAQRNFGSRPFYLSEALGVVGGINDGRGDPEGLYLMRLEDRALAERAYGAAPGSSPSVPVAYKFNMDLASTFFLTQRFRMRDNDILFVANAPSVELQKLLDIFRSAANTATTVDRTNAF